MTSSVTKIRRFHELFYVMLTSKFTKILFVACLTVAKIVNHNCCYFNANAPETLFGGLAPSEPLGSSQRSPDLLVASRGGERRTGQKGREDRKGKGRREKEGEGRKEGGLCPTQN